MQCEKGSTMFTYAMQVQASSASVVCRSGIVLGVPSDFTCSATGARPYVNVIGRHCSLKGPKQLQRSNHCICDKIANNFLSYDLSDDQQLQSERGVRGSCRLRINRNATEAVIGTDKEESRRP